VRSPLPKALVADRYAIDAPIGQGRSTVYRGTDTRLGRPVALKEVRLHSDDESHERVRRRALREARAAARLSNPSVVTVYDVVEEDGSIWLVMELVDAPSLSQLVHDRGRLDHARAALIGSDVLGALQAAHAVGVVHRDVKPANVLVGLGQRAKLADFGVALLHDDTRMTATGLVIGSPAYMSPEQALGEAVSPATDLWALGATLYYAYEGRPPFEAGNAVATASAVVYGKPRPEQHPGPLSPIVARLLEKDPLARPSTRELHQLLLEVAATPAPPPPSVVVPSPSPAATGAGGSDRPAENTVATTAVDPQEVAAAPVPAPVEAGGPGAGEPATEIAPASTADAPDDIAAEAAAAQPDEPPPTAATEVSPAAGAPGEVGAEPHDVAPTAATGRQETRPMEAAAVAVGRDDREPPGVAPGSGLRPSQQGSRRSVVRLVALVAVVLAGLVWLLTVDPDDYLGNGGDDDPRDESSDETEAPGEQTTVAAAQPPGSPTETTAAPETTTTSTTSTTAPEAPATGVPAGWRTYTHPEAGYTIAHPAGWEVVPSGHRVDIRDPGSASFLRVDWTNEPKDDPVADWRSQAQGFAASHDGYREHRIERYTYRDYNAAIWEFSYVSGGTPLHAADLGFVAGDRGYALYFVTAETDWAASQGTFQDFQSSFQP
jgi:tRNA A-37 threonylcarbamoyl transferase component Bud32